MRCPDTIPGSTWNASCGTLRIRIWRPTTARRCGVADSSAAAASSAIVAGASGTLVAASVEKYTVACDRSRVTFVPVSVTSSSRGSDMRSSSSARTSSTASLRRAVRGKRRCGLMVLRIRLEPGGVDVEQLDAGRGGDEALHRIDDLL